MLTYLQTVLEVNFQSEQVATYCINLCYQDTVTGNIFASPRVKSELERPLVGRSTSGLASYQQGQVFGNCEWEKRVL